MCATISLKSGASRAAALSVVLALAMAACGQKPGVHVASGGLEGASGANPASAPLDGATPGTTVAPGDSAGVAGPTGDAGGQVNTTGSTSTGTSTGTGSSPSGSGTASGGNTSAPGTTTPPASGQRTVTGTDRTGLSDDTIKVGSHAPVTGAAPLPSTSFEKSGDLYWRYLMAGGGNVLGRTNVELTFRDDRYDPSAARQVCRELEAEVFTFAGGGGTDQIQACGAFAEKAQVPYFSAGVTEAGLRGNPWYFASSMSYKQQMPLLAQLVRKHPDTAGKRVGAIITDTPNFDDAIEGWEAAVAAEGLNYYKTLTHPKGDTSWYNSYLSDFADNGVEVVFILSSPVDYIRFAQQSRQAGVSFQFVGVGVSMGLNAVLGSGCANNDVDKGIFFSPFPGLDWAAQNVPQFFEAGQQFDAPTDDIALALWGANATLHALFTAYGTTYGNDLTREDFRDVVENTKVSTGIFPDVSYSPTDHFGASTVHVLQADCATKQYKTLHTFAAAF